jgi:hypothetical protein
MIQAKGVTSSASFTLDSRQIAKIEKEKKTMNKSQYVRLILDLGFEQWDKGVRAVEQKN